MIKLVTILKEIQIQKVTPEEIINIIGGYPSLKIIAALRLLKKKYKYNDEMDVDNWINSQSTFVLNQIYNDLSKIQESFDKKQLFIDKARQKKSDKIASDYKFSKPEESAKQPVNTVYFQQLLNQTTLSNNTTNYIQKVLDSIKKAGGLASQNQIVFLQKFKNGLMSEISIQQISHDDLWELVKDVWNTSNRIRLAKLVRDSGFNGSIPGDIDHWILGLNQNELNSIYPKVKNIVQKLPLEESRISDIKSKLVPKFLDENEFNEIASIKVPKPIYTEWLVKVYIKEFKSQNKTIDDFMKTEPAQKIDYFEQNKNLFPNKDITSYSYNSLNQEIIKMNKDIGPSSQALSNADLDKLNKVGFKNLGIVDGYQIIKIPKGTNSPQAWQAYKNLICQGRTQVCTASNYSRFEYYTTNDNFYLLVNAEDDAAPYHVSKFTNVLKDKDDQDITDERILNIASKLK